MMDPAVEGVLAAHPAEAIGDMPEEKDSLVSVWVVSE
jgi:hypothetical protein